MLYAPIPYPYQRNKQNGRPPVCSRARAGRLEPEPAIRPGPDFTDMAAVVPGRAAIIAGAGAIGGQVLPSNANQCRMFRSIRSGKLFHDAMRR